MVLGIWKERKVISSEYIKRAKRRVEAPDREGRNSARERQAVCVGMDIDGVQKVMEEDRRENKRKRWEKALRPVNDAPGNEFEEFWERHVEEEEWRKNFPHLSYKNPTVRDPTRRFAVLSTSTPSLPSVYPSPSPSPDFRHSLSSPRSFPPTSPSSGYPSPPSPVPLSTPLYMSTPSSDLNNLNTSHGGHPSDYVYYNRLSDSGPNYQEYRETPPQYRNDWGRELQPPMDRTIDLIDRDIRDRHERELQFRELIRERELQEQHEREMRGELPMGGPPQLGPPLQNSYENRPYAAPPPHPHPPPHRPPHIQTYTQQQQPRFEEYPPPRHPEHYDYPPEPSYHDREMQRPAREYREMRDYRDPRDMRDQRGMREMGPPQGPPPYTDAGGNYRPPPQGDAGGNYRPPQGDVGGNYRPPPQGDAGGNYRPPPQGDAGGNYRPPPQGDAGGNFRPPPQGHVSPRYYNNPNNSGPPPPPPSLGPPPPQYGQQHVYGMDQGNNNMPYNNNNNNQNMYRGGGGGGGDFSHSPRSPNAYHHNHNGRQPQHQRYPPNNNVYEK